VLLTGKTRSSTPSGRVVALAMIKIATISDTHRIGFMETNLNRFFRRNEFITHLSSSEDVLVLSQLTVSAFFRILIKFSELASF
jgi:hypothetical protein